MKLLPAPTGPEFIPKIDPEEIYVREVLFNYIWKNKLPRWRVVYPDVLSMRFGGEGKLISYPEVQRKARREFREIMFKVWLDEVMN